MIPSQRPEIQKNTGFSELPISVPYVFHTCSRGTPQLYHKSSSAIAPLDSAFIDAIVAKTSTIPKNKYALAHSIYKEKLPLLIRLLRGAGFEGVPADDVTVLEIFEAWNRSVRRNAAEAGIDCEEKLPCSDELCGRFADMWGIAYTKEHDWQLLVNGLINQRVQYVTDGSGRYPETLRRLEAFLVEKNYGMSATDAAGVLLVWMMAQTNSDGQFFLSERDAGQWVCEIAGKEFKDTDHARIIGRTMLRKLIRLGVIVTVEKGVAWTPTSREGKATTYRWAWEA